MRTAKKVYAVRVTYKVKKILSILKKNKEFCGFEQILWRAKLFGALVALKIFCYVVYEKTKNNFFFEAR